MTTLKNKLCAVALMACGSLPMIVDGDPTVLVIMGCIAVPLFFARKSYVF